MSIKIENDILSIVTEYDVLFLDVYGVLYDGIKMFDNVLDTLSTLKKCGKKIIIISNMIQIASDAKMNYSQRGMFEDVHFDEMLTSGEFLKHTILDNGQQFSKMMGGNINSVKCLFMGNGNIFADSYINKADSYSDADFVYVGVPRVSYGSIRIDDLFDAQGNHVNIEDVLKADWKDLKDSYGRRGPLEILHALEPCLKQNKTLLVANPDIFAHGTADGHTKPVPIFTQGCIGRYYEKLGGKVVYFGKPYKDIFEYAKQKYTSADDKILMVGDTPWTDILGANLSCIDSAMVMSGVTREFFDKMPQDINEDKKMSILLEEISTKMMNIQGSVTPKYVIRRFAHSL